MTTRSSHDARGVTLPKTSRHSVHDTPRERTMKTFITGLVLAGLLALGDLSTPIFTDGEHPPMAIALAGAALGLLTVIGMVLAWRGSRGGITTIIVTRLLSAVTALPAFFVDDVPGAAQAAAAIGLVATVACVAFIAPRLRRPALAAAAH
jgi:FtsH-binding integral membrane protein